MTPRTSNRLECWNQARILLSLLLLEPEDLQHYLHLLMISSILCLLETIQSPNQVLHPQQVPVPLPHTMELTLSIEFQILQPKFLPLQFSIITPRIQLILQVFQNLILYPYPLVQIPTSILLMNLMIMILQDWRGNNLPLQFLKEKDPPILFKSRKVLRN